MARQDVAETAKQTCTPLIIAIIVPFINDYIAKFDQPLGPAPGASVSSQERTSETCQTECVTKSKACHDLVAKDIVTRTEAGKAACAYIRRPGPTLQKCFAPYTTEIESLIQRQKDCENTTLAACRLSCVSGPNARPALPQQQIPGPPCQLGTLRNIQLCHLMENIRVPTGVSCDFYVTLHSIMGAEKMRIVEFTFAQQPGRPANSSTKESSSADGARFALLTLGVNFGVLTGRMSTKSTGENCGLTGSWTASALTCPDNNVILGTAENPVRARLAIHIPMECENPSDVELTEFDINIGSVVLDCFRLSTALPAAVNAKLTSTLSFYLSRFLKTFLSNMIRDGARKLLARGIALQRQVAQEIVMSS